MKFYHFWTWRFTDSAFRVKRLVAANSSPGRKELWNRIVGCHNLPSIISIKSERSATPRRCKRGIQILQMLGSSIRRTALSWTESSNAIGCCTSICASYNIAKLVCGKIGTYALCIEIPTSYHQSLPDLQHEQLDVQRSWWHWFVREPVVEKI